MKIRVYKDSYYPYYGITLGQYEPEIEVTDDEYKIIKDADELTKKAQTILARAYPAK